MRYFIDTNIFIFLGGSPDEISPEVRDLIHDYENTFVMSSESLREILMLLKNGRIQVKEWRSYSDIKAMIDAFGFVIRYVDEEHLKTLDKLNPAPNHSDPADLMIIAQAITENLPLISSDTKFPFYTRQGLQFLANKPQPSKGKK